MVSFRDLTAGFSRLNLPGGAPVLVHASLSAFGEVRGGADAVTGALLGAFRGVMAPTFTYRSMIIPEDGPADNALTYGSGHDANRMAEIFTLKMPADPQMGIVAETLRRHPQARRSNHPILSFAAVGLDDALKSQTLAGPFAPIAALAELDGWVLLLGVDHTCNTAIHLGEQRAGRKRFVRWALNGPGVRECTHFPGCSLGFQQIEPRMSEADPRGDFWRRTVIGEADVQAVRLAWLLDLVETTLRRDPAALLCDRPGCELCESVRQSL